MHYQSQVIGGPAWDGMPGRTMRVTAEDALFFLSKTGRLLQFKVSYKNHTIGVHISIQLLKTNENK